MDNGINHLVALLGGALLGASTALVTAITGRRAGISGYAGALLRRASARGGPGADRRFARWFLAGMIVTGAVAAAASPGAHVDATGRPLSAFLIGGALVGWGARRANGCTSGHGIGGVARASARSIVAIALFGIAAAIVVAVWPAGGGA